MSRENDILKKYEDELNLKQLQIKSLLTITQAINDNVSAEGLFNMYKSFLSWEMGVQKMALFVNESDDWKCTVAVDYEEGQLREEIITELLKYKRLHTIKDDDLDIIKQFDIIIPVYHKDTPIAYAVIGGIKDKEDIYNKIQFITTITNIIAVAIENKRLFNKQIIQERYKKELELASQVQKMLIPENLPTGDSYELSGIYKPHLNVGGDYFDYFRFSETRFAFCIADVSGKGVAAALLMANFQAVLQSLIYQYRDLETFVFALNQSVNRITQSDKYITLFIADVDTKQRKLKYINAGHFPPLLYTGNKIHELTKGSTIIGAFDTLPDIELGEINLEGESLILSFTDGLTDLKNNNGELFNEERIKNYLSKERDKSAEAFNNGLMEELDIFKGDSEYPDDIAILTCKIYDN